MDRTEKYAFMWDMDGTLVDSYPAIVPAVKEVCAENGICLTDAYIREQVLRTSVGDLIRQLSLQHGLDPDALIRQFNAANDLHIGSIRPEPHIREVLAALSTAGHRNFVYTHRGASSLTILEETGLLPYFTEVVTALNGFPRKPSPEAILYLIEKYALSRDRCFYVGDRRLDVEAAVNAGILSILYLTPDSPVSPTGNETYLVFDLADIPKLVP